MKLDIKTIVALFAAGALSLAAPGALSEPDRGSSHGDHSADDHHDKHDHSGETAQHGGQFIHVEPADRGVEMVAKAGTLAFYVTDHGEPISLDGASFKAVVQDPGAGTKILPLKAEGEALSAALEKPLSTGTKVVFSGKGSDGVTVQARFVHK